MEKQRIKSTFRFSRRFLISLLLLLAAGKAFSQTLTLAQIKQLSFKTEEGQNLYTKTDIKFSVTIPYVSPSQVQVLSANQQSDISFRSMRKTESYEQKGTVIEIWYNFSNKGSFTLNPLSLSIQNRSRTIKFEPVTITEDPATMNPRIVLTFEDGTKVYSDESDFKNPLLTVKTGRKLRFTVNLQYAMQLVQFNWEIPKDSIFTCVQQYEFTEVRHRERVYSHSLIPVASFEWTGLVEGPQALPKIRLNAAGYNGYRSELLMPQIIIDFKDDGPVAESISDSDIFDAAFYQESSLEESKIIIPLTSEECQLLADLYSREHNGFFTYIKARRDRINFENEHGIVASTNQIFPSILLYVSLVVLIASIVCLIIAIRRKHKIRTLLFIILLLLSLAVLTYCSVRRHERYGISTACKLYSIPQANADSVSELASGSRVRIFERTGQWYYIEMGESGGWCRADQIYIIR